MDYTNLIMNLFSLKDLKRSGWVKKQIINPESVADHTFGVVLLATTIELPDGVDRNKLIKMAVMHDLAEVHVGDIIWEQGKYADKDLQQDKHSKETYFFTNMIKKFKDFEKLRDLSLDFMDLKTKTAIFLKDLDKLDMAFQALIYEQRVDPKTLNEFWENVEKHLKFPQTKQIFENLKKRRII